MTPLVLVGALCALTTLGAVVATLLWWRERGRRRAATERVAVLEADLDAALRPRPATTQVERAVRQVVRTAAQLRSQGVGGLLTSSLDDLQAWASERRHEIATMAASDGTVTLFFSDIEGSTSLNARLGDEAFVKVLASHDALVRGRVERYRGQVVKTAGDGFMVAFRDAEAACRAATSIQRRLAAGRAPRLRRAGIAVRIGVHTGTAVTRDGDYFGRNVAMAARVGDLAHGGQVLVTDAVREALDDDAAVVLARHGEVELRGLPGRHVVWEVTRRGQPALPPAGA